MPNERSVKSVLFILLYWGGYGETLTDGGDNSLLHHKLAVVAERVEDDQDEQLEGVDRRALHDDAHDGGEARARAGRAEPQRHGGPPPAPDRPRDQRGRHRVLHERQRVDRVHPVHQRRAEDGAEGEFGEEV